MKYKHVGSLGYVCVCVPLRCSFTFTRQAQAEPLGQQTKAVGLVDVQSKGEWSSFRPSKTGNIGLKEHIPVCNQHVRIQVSCDPSQALSST